MSLYFIFRIPTVTIVTVTRTTQTGEVVYIPVVTPLGSGVTGLRTIWLTPDKMTPFIPSKMTVPEVEDEVTMQEICMITPVIMVTNKELVEEAVIN
jgi:hypothetical protein